MQASRIGLWVFQLFLATELFGETVLVKYSELPKLIQANSRELKAAQLLAEASAARQGFLGRSRYPRLDLESGFRGEKETDGSGDSAPFLKVEGQINLYRGGRDALKDTLQEKETAMRKVQAQEMAMNQLQLAREYFVRLAFVRERKIAWDSAVKMNKQMKDTARTKSRAGLTTNTDLLEFEIHDSSLKREQRSLEKEEHELSQRMLMLLGLKEESELRLDRSFGHPPEPKESHYKLQSKTHPRVQSLTIQADQAKTVAEARASRWTPELNLFANYERNLQKNTDQPSALPQQDISAGIRLSLPIGDNMDLKREAYAKSMEATAYALQSQQSEREISISYHEYLHDMQVLHKLIHDSEEQIEKAKKHLRQTRQEYERGIKNGPDVLEATRTLYRTEVESIQLALEYYLAEVGIATLTAQES